MIAYKLNQAARVPVRLLNSAGSAVTGVAFGAITVTIEKADGTVVNFTPTGSDWIEITTGAYSGAGKYTLILPASAISVSGPLSYAVLNVSAKVFIGSVQVVTNEEVDTKTVVDAIRSDYTSGRATKLDFLDVAISSRAAPSDLTTIASNVAGLRADYTTPKAAFLDIAISSRAAPSDLTTIASDTAGLRADYTTPRAVKLDYLDAAITSRAQASDLTSIAANVTTALKHLEGRWKIHVTGPDANRLVIYDTDEVTVLKKYNLLDAAGNPTPFNPFEREPV